MPEEEIPNDAFNDSPESSLSSNSSLRNFNLNRELINNQRNRQNSISSNSSTENVVIRRNIHFNPNNDEEFYNPNQAYLFPVQPVRFENTLDVILRNITGRNDLDNVQSVKLRVISASVSLYTLSIYMPNLTSLSLEGSVLCSLRDLGYNLDNLVFLNVSNCGLTSLDGTSGFPSVKILIADRNMIQLIGPIQNLIILKKLSLRENQLTNLNMLTFLGACTLLEEVDLQGNPVTKDPYYRVTLKQSMPSLNSLDGLPTKTDLIEKEENNSMSTDENEIFSPSTLSDDGSIEESIKSDLNNSLVSVEIQERPSTSSGVCVIKLSSSQNNNSRRPSTATTLELQNRRRLLTSGPPICGSITSIIRKKRSSDRKTAWKDDTSSSSSFSSSDNSLHLSTANQKEIIEKNFPEKLPQTSVDLSSIGSLNCNAEQKR